MTAPAERNTAVNVGGTTHAVELARALDAKHLHHVSSIAVAGNYRGVFSEEMFDEGQRLPSPYHRTKFESERIVREQPYVPWRVYRPGIVVGDSQTGEMDKIDGPVLLLQGDPARCASCCPSGCRWSASTSATRTSCRSTGWRPRSSTSRTSPTSTAAPSTSPTRARSASTS